MGALTLTPQQQAVVENRGGSLLVSAAAGSGKTKVLVERLFRYVTEEHCNVDDFLIITYTKAAAAELRSKIAAELGKRLAQTPGDGHLRRQLLRVYQADIKTVDAFCTALLRENTHLLAREEDRWALTPDFRVLDESDAHLVRRRVLGQVLEDFYGRLDDGRAQLADTLGAGRDDSRLAELVLEVHEKLQSHASPAAWLAENRRTWRTCRGPLTTRPMPGSCWPWSGERAATGPPSWSGEPIRPQGTRPWKRAMERNSGRPPQALPLWPRRGPGRRPGGPGRRWTFPG